ncbi:helix-turn-helix domain-containing protein [Caenispirillum bisanense]|uniref:Transcriptional regulator, AraC family n=1 Tax=Caenispirillum bisanense TaxID=414052 RepID=A0A286G7X1_9PROT|nr:helix-turn-helix domain-containing protein [Caenispirillum bisanense]SOD91637.1 transcriptional regulator, AraC family [Caenispirillum bisanense]
MALRRMPKPALQPFVSSVWATDATAPTPLGARRELMLPAGAMHVAIRLGGSPLRIYTDPADAAGTVVGGSVLNGMRLRAYCKATGDGAACVGALLKPGAADLLSNTPAGALAGRHTNLEDLWPRADLADLRERLEATPALDRRLDLFEAVLERRLASLRRIDPMIAHALCRFDGGSAIAGVVRDSGVSHRHFVRVFTEAVGLSPKSNLRLHRFDAAVTHLHAAPEASLADLAALAGYADQAHMTREFRAFSGLTPGRYRRLAPVEARHVLLAP